MRRIGIGLLSGVGGYLAGAVVGYGLVWLLSGNVHDRDLEAATMGAFVAGPAGAVLALAAGLAWPGRKFRPVDARS